MAAFQPGSPAYEAMIAENARLRAALEPFAVIGRPLIAATASGAIPAGASARFLKLGELKASDFVGAARAIERQ